MARLQTDPPLPRIEDLLAKENAKVLDSTQKKADPLQFCPASLAAKVAAIDDLSEKELRALIRRLVMCPGHVFPVSPINTLTLDMIRAVRRSIEAGKPIAIEMLL